VARVAVPEAPTAVKPKRPWRDNLEAFGVAILMAVLLKPMLIEAYQIPTPSMQPTLMGSSKAGVFDRILVDKVCYEFTDPKRWDIAVFRYPIRRNQNYVKRIVGIPEDRLRIAGGNLYQVAIDGSIAGINRKPDRIQRGLWKNIYPLRRLMADSNKIVDQYFIGNWRQDGDDLVATPTSRGRTRLSFNSLSPAGLSNKISDGYSPADAKAIASGPNGGGREGVQDVRWRMELTPQSEVQEIEIDLQLTPAGHDPRHYRFSVKSGVGRLVILTGDTEAAASEPFEFALPAGETTAVGFAHVDDRLLAWHDGDQAGELEVGDLRELAVLSPGQVQLGMRTDGGGELRMSNIRVDRDLHYTTTGLDDDLANLVPEGMPQVMKNHVIAVPAGYYMMMGDNTLASADARQWKVIELGLRDGVLADPSRHADARSIKGNKRPWGLNGPPDADENPVIVRDAGPGGSDLFAFTDDNGEVFAMTGELGPDYDDRNLQFIDVDGGERTTWVPKEEHVYFVPREHILGRPILGFWPLMRIGLIR